MDLERAEKSSKNTATGLMRSLISIWYSGERLAGYSATAGINSTIRTAVFSKLYHNTYEHIANAASLSEYCEDKYGVLTKKLETSLVNMVKKEESIRLLKQQLVIAYVYNNISHLYTL